MAKGKGKTKGKGKAREYELDFDDYDDSQDEAGYDGDVPKRGIYDGSLISFREHVSQAGNEGFEWIFEINGGKYDGWRGWVYTNMESAKWKTQQTVRALQGGKKEKIVLKPKPQGASDGGMSETVLNAQPVRLRIRNEEYEDETRAKINRVLPLNGTPAKDTKKKKKKVKASEEPPF